MALKTFKPTSPGTRQLVIVDRSDLWKGKPVKTLTEGLSKSGGRNNRGRNTAPNRGGGHKRTYRVIDFKRRKFDIEATVERIEYDPNRTAYIALLRYDDGELAYILAPQRLAAGDKVVAGAKVDVKPGNAMPMSSIPVGTIVHNIELKPGKGGQVARSAGGYAQIVGRDQGLHRDPPELRRTAPRSRHLHGDRRCGFQSGSHEHQPGQGGTFPLARQAPARAWRGDEPGRPSARRW